MYYRVRKQWNTAMVLLAGYQPVLFFVFSFSVLYFGIKAYIGITTQGGAFYSAFLDRYLNVVMWYRNLLFAGSKLILHLLGYKGTVLSKFIIQINGSNKVQLVYSCLGYGFISCWIAFVVSIQRPAGYKLSWIIAGIITISIMNMCRIAMLLIAKYRHYSFPLPLDHHTIFNICCYSVAGISMYVYGRLNLMPAPRPAGKKQHTTALPNLK